MDDEEMKALEQMTKEEVIERYMESSENAAILACHNDFLEDENRELKNKLDEYETLVAEAKELKISNEQLQKVLEAAKDDMLLDDGEIK